MRGAFIVLRKDTAKAASTAWDARSSVDVHNRTGTPGYSGANCDRSPPVVVHTGARIHPFGGRATEAAWASVRIAGHRTRTLSAQSGFRAAETTEVRVPVGGRHPHPGRRAHAPIPRSPRSDCAPTLSPMKPRRASEPIYSTAIVAGRAMFGGLRLKRSVMGADNIPSTGGAVLAMTHFGYLEFALVEWVTWLTTRRRVRFLAKQSVFDKPVVGSVRCV